MRTITKISSFLKKDSFCKILVLSLIITLNNVAFGAVNTYSFSQSSGTYTVLSTETILWSGSFDDEVSSAITIPSFTMDGTAYSTMYVSANGWITLGTIAPGGTDYYPISSSAAYSRVISAFGYDLNNYGSGTRKVSYNVNVSGEIVIQWQNVRSYNYTTHRVSFQIRLNPISGVIKIVYGGTIAGSTTSAYLQVGLRGSSNADYSNRSVAYGTTTWATSTNGTSNTSSCQFRTSCLPANGLTYSWTPSLTPTLSVNPSSLDFGYIPSGGTSPEMTYSLSGTNLSPASGNITITPPSNFEVSLTTGSGFSSSAITKSYSGGALSATTIYARFKPTAPSTNYSGNITNAGGSATTQNVAVTGTSILTYCTAGATTCDEYIYQVQVGSINNITACTSGGYADYTGLSTNMTVGVGYAVTITNGLAYTGDQCGIWVDWNQDGDFSDINETIIVTGSTSVFTATITPPSGSTLGTTRLRIRITYTGAVSSCGTATYGEVEDYSINVQETPPVDLAFTGFFQLSENKNFSFENNLTNHNSVNNTEINNLYDILTEDGENERSSTVNNTVILPNFFSGQGTSKDSFTPVELVATISNLGMNSSLYVLDWNVGGVSQPTYNGPSVASGGTDNANLTYTPTACGTFITSGTVSATDDADPSNNSNSFRMRVYPDGYTRTTYDRGDNVVDTYVGWGDINIAMKAGVRFTATEDTKLTGVDFIYRTEDVTSGTILVQVRAAGSGTGAPGALLYSKSYNTNDYIPSGLIGEYITFAFGNDAPTIASGSDYWITIKMPVGVLYPGGVHNNGFTSGRSFYEIYSDTTVWNALVITTERAWIMRSIYVTCTAPVVTAQPSNSTITYGDAASFSVTTSNSNSYQWEEYITSWNPVSNGGIYSGANTASLQISKATVSMSGYKYRCVVSGNCELTTTSNGNATLMVTPKGLTVTANSGQFKYFGQADPVFTYAASGFVPGEDESVLTGTLSRIAGEPVGNYAITIGSLAGANYSINFSSADFEIKPAYLLSLTVFLQSTYNSGSGQMNTALNTLLPTSQPFNTSPWNYYGTETLPSPLSPDVVDWILVELRSDENTTFERKAGLLYKNGSVKVSFTGSSSGGNYVVVWHRGHMPVMSVSNVNLPVEGASYNLSTLSNLYGNDMEPALPLGGDVYGMISGDVTQNGLLKYSGPYNDRGPIIAKIIAVTGSNNINSVTPSGYWQEDVSLNGIVSYIGTGNDRSPIISNLGYLIGTPYLNNTYTSVVPGVYTGGGKEGLNDGPVDIQFAETDDDLAIEIVTNELIENGIVDNIQFTLAWKTGDDEIEELLNTYTSNFNLLPQGDAVEVDGNQYLTFVSLTPTTLPQAWNSGETVNILSFNKEYGQLIADRLWIADNDFTSDKNGEYYLSNLGTDVTGMILNSSTVGVETINAGFVKMFPNPVTAGNLFIQLSTSRNENLETEIWDMTGKLVTKVSDQTGAGTITLTIDVSKLNAGMYLINIVGDKVIYTDRFIIK